MNLPAQIKSISPREAEEMLRAVAQLPAPLGLEDRVHAALRGAPRRARNEKVLAWPADARIAARGWMRGWMRGAAAAAIVFAVAGGGWGIYSRLQPAPAARVIAMPRVTGSGGFSNAGAMRTPRTLNMPAPAGKTPRKPARRKPALAGAKATLSPSR